MTNDFDEIIPGLIKAGREQAERFQNTCYLTQTWKITFDEFPPMPFEIKKRPLQALESVEYIDSDGVKTAMNLDDFIVGVESNRIGFKARKTWPQVTLQEFDSVTFICKAGNDDITMVPETVKLAIKLFVSENIEKPDDPEIPKGFHNLLWTERQVPT